MCPAGVLGLWLCLSQTLAEVRNRTERHGLLRESTRLPPVIRSWLYTGLALGPQLPEGRTASPSGTRAPPLWLFAELLPHLAFGYRLTSSCPQRSALGPLSSFSFRPSVVVVRPLSVRPGVSRRRRRRPLSVCPSRGRRSRPLSVRPSRRRLSVGRQCAIRVDSGCTTYYLSRLLLCHAGGRWRVVCPSVRPSDLPPLCHEGGLGLCD